MVNRRVCVHRGGCKIKPLQVHYKLAGITYGYADPPAPPSSATESLLPHRFNRSSFFRVGHRLPGCEGTRRLSTTSPSPYEAERLGTREKPGEMGDSPMENPPSGGASPTLPAPAPLPSIVPLRRLGIVPDCERCLRCWNGMDSSVAVGVSGGNTGAVGENGGLVMFIDEGDDTVRRLVGASSGSTSS